MEAPARQGEASPSVTLPPPSLIERLSELLCAAALLGMAALTGAEAIVRNLFGFSLQITDEVGGYLLVAVTFLSLSIAQVHGAYHQVELVQGRLSPRARLVSQLGFDILSLIACAVVTWQLARMNLNSWRSGDMAPTLLLTPLWIPQLSMPIGMALFCVALARTIVARWRRLRQTAVGDGR
jgi:TRAP-type C4-dicarboxylate transport system permease small subunit